MTPPRHGLRALLAAWEAFADSLADGYDLGLDDYLNDVDVRRLLAERLAVRAPRADGVLAQRLATADAAVRAATEPARGCLWGSRNAAANGYRRDAHWYYFAVPRERSAEFDADLARVR